MLRAGAGRTSGLTTADTLIVGLVTSWFAMFVGTSWPCGVLSRRRIAYTEEMFKSFKLSVLVVALALLGLAALPAYPQTETASAKLRPAEVDNSRKLLGENLSGPSRNVAEGDAEPSAGG